MTEPTKAGVASWTIGSLPVECPDCGTVCWFMPGATLPECCGSRLRWGGSDQRTYLWLADYATGIRRSCVERIERAVRAEISTP